MILRLKSRPSIQKNTNDLLECIGEKKFDEASVILDRLESDITKYFITRKETPDGIYEKIHKIRVKLTHGRVLISFEQKQRKIYLLIRDLVVFLSYEDKDMTLKSKLEQITSDIREDFDNFCVSGYMEDMDVILDDFKALRKLSLEIQPLGSKIYKAYSQVMRYSGECSGLLPKMMPLNPIARERGTIWKPGESALNSITSSFASLYSSLEDLIALIDAPEEDDNTEKENDKKNFSESDIEDQQRNALRAEALRLLTEEDKSLQKIAPLLGMTMDELMELLDLER